MTGQVPDTLLRGRVEWVIAGARGSGLFDPGEHGIRPVMLSTACWHGFICRYAVGRRRLTLDRLDVGLPEAQHEAALAGDGPPIAGRRPALSGTMGAWRYESLGLPIAFTGTLLIGRDFIQELYVHMGFQPASSYREVRELTFDSGRFTGARDVGARMEVARSRLADPTRAGTRKGPEVPGRVLRDWVAERFDRTYEPEDLE